MKTCRRCNLMVHTSREHCPLCFESLSTLTSTPAPDSFAPVLPNAAYDALISPSADPDRYPPDNEASAIRYDFVVRLLLFISIVVVSVSTLINLLLNSGFLWCLIVAGSILYLWIAVAYPIIRKKNIGQIIVLETCVASLILYLVQLATNTIGWALDYATPFMFSVATLMITLIILLKRMKWRQFAVYQMSTMLLGLLPALLCAVGLVKVLWPSLLSALYSFLTLIGMFIFADKKYRNEIIKRFHV